MFRKFLKEGRAGDNAGLLLRSLKREDVERGQVIVKPGTVKAYTKFQCKVVVLSAEEGGRSKEFRAVIVLSSLRTTDVTGAITLLQNADGTPRPMVLPGDMDVDMEVQMHQAYRDWLRFAIRRCTYRRCWHITKSLLTNTQHAKYLNTRGYTRYSFGNLFMNNQRCRYHPSLLRCRCSIH